MEMGTRELSESGTHCVIDFGISELKQLTVWYSIPLVVHVRLPQPQSRYRRRQHGGRREKMQVEGINAPSSTLQTLNFLKKMDFRTKPESVYCMFGHCSCLSQATAATNSAARHSAERSPFTSSVCLFNCKIQRRKKKKHILQPRYPPRKMVACSACNAIFLSEPELLRHISNFHRNDASVNMRCGVEGCPKTFTNEHFDYVGHRNIVLGARVLQSGTESTLVKDSFIYIPIIDTLKPIVDDLKHLENGIVLENGRKMFAYLAAFTGDNLGLHAIGGFKEGFKAYRPCRFCLATQTCLTIEVLQEDPAQKRIVTARKSTNEILKQQADIISALDEDSFVAPGSPDGRSTPLLPGDIQPQPLIEPSVNEISIHIVPNENLVILPDQPNENSISLNNTDSIVTSENPGSNTSQSAVSLTRAIIVREVASRIRGAGIRVDSYKVERVAEAVVARFPILADAVGSGLSYVNSRAGGPSAAGGQRAKQSRLAEIDDAKRRNEIADQDLAIESGKESPNLERIKNLLDCNRTHRISFGKKADSKSYLQKYQCFYLKPVVNQNTQILLANIHKLMRAGITTNENTKLVLQLFPAGTVIESTRPAASDPPRLIAVGDATDELSISCYVDNRALFVTKSPMEAMILLLASYWVFQVNFPSEAKAPLLLLVCCTAGTKHVTAQPCCWADVAHNSRAVLVYAASRRWLASKPQRLARKPRRLPPQSYFEAVRWLICQRAYSLPPNIQYGH
ncbi:hypothetical protein B566_EDAN007009 [Ephemera danica]|nr:hypothetical protein B566_EDAN007009 [Ephemera danica]